MPQALMRARLWRLEKLEVPLLGIWDLGFGARPMAAATRILSLNLGSHTVGLAEFHTQPNGGVVLNGYRLREILADPANESARNAQIAAALPGKLGGPGGKGGPVNYSPGGQFFFRPFGKLPGGGGEKNSASI